MTDIEKIEATILKQCDLDVEDMYLLTPDEFVLHRKNGLGASDMSAILGGLNKFKTEDDVLRDKLTMEVTPEDIEISNKPAVRKGRDLEDMILQKASNHFERRVYKVPNQYRVRTYPQLTINYDGLMWENDRAIPVEAKLTTMYGDKYWDYGRTNADMCPKDVDEFDTYCNAVAQHHGVPVNYLIQLQQQLIGVDAPYGYIVSLRDKDWTLYVFKIPKYPVIIQRIYIESYKFWNKLQSYRK